MSLDLSLETEARIEARAKEQGMSIDAYLERLMTPPVGVPGLEILKQAGIQPRTTANGDPVLPARYLGVRGSLHRRDIYDDVD
ncbi:MAG TPA: hypothetical protein VKU19_04785 [Bryobacteraceae bacterium]|nr:hypothetical protein [Bryobacteraceae bacterium]